ncbi:hypothetical protein C7B65_25335 [Phormidesmis priestleyi ULC007]|uniref:Pentapeptide MXKDX repeat protein n=1 Tax=Phormidesmis priestleyi ULC007 TaxID=1920490 RepID=A0A2T1D3S4_9CYAN|nr:hypothetical protein [Phormidesmis priestleyi]PSB15064.1 hypothetical protein C7B65_25335 [Phormidesmis priestleyi ULC007]
MNKLYGIKVAAAGAIALLFISAIAAGNAFAQDNQKPAAQTEQMSGCECCKKMMEKKTNDSQNKMPGMNHSAPSGK